MKAFFEARTDPMFVGQMTSYAFPMHVHECVELACVLSGGCTMQINDATYHLKPGDFAVVFPLTPHSFESIDDDTAGFASFFLSEAIPEFAHTFHHFLPDEPVIPAARLDDEVHEVIKKLMTTPNEEYSPFRLAYLHLLLAHLMNSMTFHPVESGKDRGLAARAIRYIYEHACEKITLDSAAYELGISKSHLSHLFSQQFHINFRHFINAIRIDKAIMQMHDPTVTLTQICYACGYENMRTFRRAFIQETGVLPSEYMRQISPTAQIDT